MSPFQKAGLYLLCVPVGIMLGVFLAAFIDKMGDELKVYRATGHYDGVLCLCLAFVAVSCGIVGVACLLASFVFSL